MKVALADVLWDAANTNLWDGVSEYDDSADRIPLDLPSPPRQYTCDAVFSTCGGRNTSAEDFIGALGCQPHSLFSFLAFEVGEERQGVRYMWLLLAMHVAEDEQIMIEVER